jgi:predicted secreted protein
MGSNAVSGVGTIFRKWDPLLVPDNKWVNIAEISNVDGPSKSRDTIDVTSLDSTSGYREFIAGFRDGGTVALSMNFTRATYEIMNDDFESDVIVNYEVILPDPEHTTIEFQGLVTEVGLAIPMDDKISSDVSIKVSGRVIVNSGASVGL